MKRDWTPLERLAYYSQSQMIPKIGVASYAGKSSVIVDSRYQKSLTAHLQEAGLKVLDTVPCDRRILGFHWEGNEMVPVIDPSLEKTSEVWIKLEDPDRKAGEAIGSWFGKELNGGAG
jgi:hypothetical protein